MIVLDYLNIQDSSFSLMIPVQTTTILPNFVHLAFLKGGNFVDAVSVFPLAGVMSQTNINTNTRKFTDSLKELASA